jgi:multimeric flavodoxin WrbA
MNVLALLGSPRTNGNTETILDSLVKGLHKDSQISIAQVKLDELEIRACTHCDSCRNTDDRYCIFLDDMQPLYQRFIDAQLVILASPVYWWNVSAQLKLFIDRLYGLDPETHPERFKGKKIVLVLTYADEDPNSGAEITINMFQEIAAYTNMDLVEILRFCSGDRHVREVPDILDQAHEIGIRLGRSDGGAV